MKNNVRFAVFASGSGSNFEVIAKEVKKGNIPAELVFLFTDKKEAFANIRAEKLGIPHCTIALKDCKDKAAYEEQILTKLKEEKIDFIVLAGYMKIVSATLLGAYEDKIINIHPAYLPEFPGANGIKDAFEAGVQQSGVTVHFVDSGIDTGKIIAQRRVAIKKEDTLASFEERIHEEEYRLYPEVLKKLFQNKGEKNDKSIN